MGKQKLQQHSGGYLYLFVPRPFARKWGLRKGDQVKVRTHGRKIVFEIMVVREQEAEQ